MRLLREYDFPFPRVLVPAVSTAGCAYKRSVAVGMPRIPADILHSPFYLYRDRKDAEEGSRFEGTGFFVGYPTGINDIPILLYGITNWHVAVRDGFSVMRLNKLGGGVDIFEFDPSEWEFPPGGPDLAVMPHYRIGLNESVHHVVALHLEMFASQVDLAEVGIGPGDDIFMLGRFVDHDGAASNVPSARFGNISVMPQAIPQSTGAKNIPSFILDVHSRTGYSGSPVFVYRTIGSDLSTDLIDFVNITVRAGRTSMTAPPRGHFLKLLGLQWGQFPEQWEIKSKKKTIIGEVAANADERYIEGMSGMTLAIPAWTIREFLEMPKFREARTKAIREISEHLQNARMGGAPVAESSLPASDENPTHREDFKSLLGAAARTRPSSDKT